MSEPKTDAFGNPIVPRGPGRTEPAAGAAPAGEPPAAAVPPPLSGAPGHVPPALGMPAPPPLGMPRPPAAGAASIQIAPRLLGAILVSVFGLFCCWVIGQLAGIALSLRALQQIRESGGALSGRGGAIALIWLNVAALIFWIVILATGTWTVTDGGVRFNNP